MGHTPAEIRIGISACLLGQRVRFDGGHKRHPFITEIFARFITLVPVCPEVEIGLGTPREPLRLVRSGGQVRMAGQKSGTDHTEAMRRYAAKKAEELAALDLSGFILKKDSPSCGMERVRVYNESGAPSKCGRGLFAEALLTRLPLLPVEEEGRLEEPRLRENFIERVFACRRLQDLFGRPWKVADVIRLHTAEKFLLMSHDPAAYKRLGRLVAAAKSAGRREFARKYQQKFMRALARPATTRRHANVLQHLAGHFRKLIRPEEKSELASAIQDYCQRLVPLIVPITLIRHYARLHRVSYLEGQRYLEPHPKELMLRNHV